MARRPPPLSSRAAARALEAVASPVRQEMLSALGDAPATITALAGRLGRTRQALYHHVAVLERAGLVVVAGSRGAGRTRERVYRVVRGRLAIAARSGSKAERRGADRALGAMLRLTARECRRALADPAVRRSGSARELVALRGKARLTRHELAGVNGHINRIAQLIGQAKGRTDGPRLYSVTLVMTPAREGARGRERARRAKSST